MKNYSKSYKPVCFILPESSVTVMDINKTKGKSVCQKGKFAACSSVLMIKIFLYGDNNSQLCHTQ